jgi:signal transduction histidine kinase
MLFGLFYYMTQPTKRPPEAIKGELDLSLWDFEEDDMTFLNGEWDFYPGSLIESDEIGFREGHTIRVPGNWNHETLMQPARGNGTYHLLVKLPPLKNKLVLKVQNIWMAHKLFINGELVKEMGSTAEEKTYYVAQNTPYLIALEPNRQLEIVIQVSNHNYYNGGIVNPIQLGDEAQMTMRGQLAFGSDMAGFFLFLFFGVFHLHMYQMRKQELTYLWSGVYLIVVSVVIITSGEKLFMRLFGGMPFEIAYRIQELSVFLSFPFVMLFMYTLEPGVLKEKTLKKVILPVGIYLLLIVVAPYTFYISFKPYMTLYISLIQFIAAFRLVNIVFRKQIGQLPSNELWSVAMSILCVAMMLWDAILYHVGYVNTNIIGKISTMGFLMCLNILLARRFTNKMNEVQALSLELKEANDIKDEFLARTSHELRTPLHGIINIAGYLLTEKEYTIPLEQRENISLIQDTSMKLSLLVNDLIDVIKLRHEDLQLRVTTVDLYVLIQIVFQMMSFDLRGKELRLINLVNPMTFVEGDENRLRQILYNITSNAIKYTESGKITARIILENGQVFLNLSDTGIGIPKEEWEKIFEDSYRGTFHKNSPDSGMGLGLYISRELSRKMKGDLWIAYSEIGEGTIISLRLPQGEIVDFPLDTVHMPSRTPYIERPLYLSKMGVYMKRILLVDDEPTNIRVLSLILKESFQIFTAYRGEEALAILQRQPIDLVITDMMMPGMSGIELVQSIRKKYSPIDLPIIMTTVRNDDRDIELAYQAGANDYVTKPFGAEEISSRVRMLLQLAEVMETALQNERAFLQAQIKPHFLHNALSNIIALCYEDGERAAELLTLLSSYLRHIFQLGQFHKLFPLRQELDIIQAYVEIEKLRFGGRLSYETYIELSGMEEEMMIPPLIIQPLIENAIRHGLFNKRGEGRVVLMITEVEEFVRIAVEDDGIGMSDEQISALMNQGRGEGVGIKNIKKRVESFGKASLHIDSELEKGTKCVLFLPKEVLRFTAERTV